MEFSFGASLVLLLCLSGAARAAQGDTQGAPPGGEPGNPSTADIWSQVKRLGSMVVEQRERLRHMEEEANALRAQRSTAETTSFTASMNQLQDMLTFSSLFLKDARVTHNGAFSAGLSSSGFVGPFGSDTTVLYDRRYIGIGSEYIPSKGVYRAPVGGVYQFRFSAAYIVPVSSQNQCIQILVGVPGTSVFHVCGSSNPGQVEHVSHVFTLSLRTNMEVSVRLPAGWRLSNENSSHNVFSGALVYRP